MNPISAFFVRNIVVVFFFYGLAFFVLGLALLLASRQSSELRFAQAIRPLAFFGILHGVHEWIEMFQKIAVLTSGYTPGAWEEVARLAVLNLSFVMLLAFGIVLLAPSRIDHWWQYRPIVWMVLLWAAGVSAIALTFRPLPMELAAVADALARYSLGIPGALLGTWALMAQQRTFREHDMPQFGRDLVWCAAALFLYGAVGQIFVRQTLLAPTNLINSMVFLQWFGIPVQLFRGAMAAVLAFYMVRALRAFELENQRRLERANQSKLAVQAAALEAERRTSQEMERLNEDLRLAAHELALLLDLSNLLDTPASLPERLYNVLNRIVRSLSFVDAGMILLVEREGGTVQVQATIGFDQGADRLQLARSLGERCVTEGMAICRHLDGTVLKFSLEEALERQECRQYASPTAWMGLPLAFRQTVIGSVVLAHGEDDPYFLSYDELKIMVGLAQQLGLSIENALLHQEARQREKLLGELLRQVVDAQESERRRIARELHDATGQSLTAVALGLRGVESILANGAQAGSASLVMEQIRELKSFSTNALGELRQIIADLRPPQLDELGLVAALRWYIQAFEKRRSIPVEFVVQQDPGPLPSGYKTVLFRITQEALTNIAKHADATQVTVRLETLPSQICLSIVDNGRGFDPKAVLGEEGQRSGWGLLGIRERTQLLGGDYEIDAGPGQGTRIRVSVPLVREVPLAPAAEPEANA